MPTAAMAQQMYLPRLLRRKALSVAGATTSSSTARTAMASSGA